MSGDDANMDASSSSRPPGAQEQQKGEESKMSERDELRAKIQTHRLWPALQMLIDDPELAPVAKRARVDEDVEAKERVRAYQTRAVSLGTFRQVFEVSRWCRW